MRDDREPLADILDAIDRAQRYAVRGRAAFESDELIQAWMVQQRMVIGEAAGQLSGQVRERSPRSVVENVPSLRKAVSDLLDERG